MNIRVALYARVSSETQVQTGTIDSQINALQEKIKKDGHKLINEYQFVDDGYSGSILLRPALERLRDAAANYLFDKLYVHAPDRLARKYAYQYLLIEEFNRLGIEIIFLTNQRGTDPESELLLQVQGIISEYERTKIMERSRRGKLHAAKLGLHSVLSCAPYGYRYISKKQNGIALFEVIEEEAEVLRLIFSWVGQERISICSVARRLTELGFPTPKGKNTKWNRGSISHMLRNPTYKGEAAYGKHKSVPRKPRLRPRKGQAEHPKITASSERTPKEKWITIPVPPIIDTSLFDAVQEQLEINKRLKRARKTGVRYLLQGLIVCDLCNYGYYGNTGTGKRHNYYVCGGSSRVNYISNARCKNLSIRADYVEEVVWQEVKHLLNNPFYLEKEFSRRQNELEKNVNKNEHNKISAEKSKLEKSIFRLIDSYTDGLIEKNEFEPRIKNLKRRLSSLEQQLKDLTNSQTQEKDLKIIIGQIEEFSALVKQNLEKVDWEVKRGIFESLIKHVELGIDKVNVVFRVSPYKANDASFKMEDCRRSRCSNTICWCKNRLPG